MKCKFSRVCGDNQCFTCQNGGGNYCGKFRELSEEIEHQLEKAFINEPKEIIDAISKELPNRGYSIGPRKAVSDWYRNSSLLHRQRQSLREDSL